MLAALPEKNLIPLDVLDPHVEEELSSTPPQSSNPSSFEVLNVRVAPGEVHLVIVFHQLRNRDQHLADVRLLDLYRRGKAFGGGKLHHSLTQVGNLVLRGRDVRLARQGAL